MRSFCLYRTCVAEASGKLCACALHTGYCAGTFSYGRESVVTGLGSEMLLCSPRVDETPPQWKKRSPSLQRVRALILFP
jgi:hypothetical protein